MNTHERHLSRRLDATINGMKRGRVSRLVYRLLRLRKRLIEAAVFGGGR